jgi:hypothetical protein
MAALGNADPWERARNLDYEGGPFRELTMGGSCATGRPLADGAKPACTMWSGYDGAHSYELAGYVPRRQDIWHRPTPPGSPRRRGRRTAKA